MPDTKSGREKKGKNKRAQLRMHLAERELESLDGEEELPLSAEVTDGDADDADLLADELPDDE